MSKISLKPNASGTGVFSLKAPNSNTDRTLNLPDEAGSVLTDVSDIESQVKTATNATGSAPVYACRAWVNFDGTGAVSVVQSGNVSSITDNGTGQYAVNFTNAMPDNEYAVSGTSLHNLGTNNYFRGWQPVQFLYSSRVEIYNSVFTDGTLEDSDRIFLVVFR